ncbi:MAG: phosphoenolpyruvate synthase [Candidatus Pacearchaeota archaeon]
MQKEEGNENSKNESEIKKSDGKERKSWHDEKLQKLVVWLSEISKKDVDIAGGKGANLAEMYNAGFPVPPAFVVTAQAYAKFLEYNELNEKIKLLLSNFDYENTAELEERARRIRELIINAEMPDFIAQEIIEAYEILSSDISTPTLQKMFVSEPCFTAVRSSATAEDLLTASFAGQQETYLNVKGGSALLEAIKKCWASLFTARATYYRYKKGFSHETTLIAVIVQRMINAEKSGVIFTIEPVTNDKSKIVIEAVFGLGEGIVSGTIEPDYYLVNKNDLSLVSKKIGIKKLEFTRDAGGKNIRRELPPEKQQEQVLEPWEIRKLAEYALKLERHYLWPQDIEWAEEGGNIYIVQTRAVTTAEKITERKEVKAEPILKGLAASPGIASGKVKIILNLEELKKIERGDVLVTTMTNPDMVPVMMKSNAIVTNEGGLTCHAAIVSRELGIPCVVGTRNATTILKDGTVVTVDGIHGYVYEGEIKIEKPKEEIKCELIKSGEERTKVKVNCDLPAAAERAARLNPDGIGLVRIEFAIVEGGIHPAQYIREGKINDYVTLLVNALEGIAKYFPNKPIWVRTSDIRTDEYRSLKGGHLEPIESDPMIGWHGIRRGLDEPEILRAEFKAIKILHEKGFKNIGVMIPFVINVDELKMAKEIMKEVGIEPCKDVEFGVMIETPAACWIIEELCKEGINFISFGTNDLTQLTLGVDRNNERIAKLFDEMHPAVLKEIEMVIEICKRYGVKTSICGQAASREDMAEFLVKKGIDSLSVNIDAINKIREVVARIAGVCENKKV